MVLLVQCTSSAPRDSDMLQNIPFQPHLPGTIKLFLNLVLFILEGLPPLGLTGKEHKNQFVTDIVATQNTSILLH